MRTFDLSPFTRSTVGFDRMLRLLDNVAGEAPSYPPYDIVADGENQYRITVAVAGFGEDELDVTVQENQLTIKGGAGKGAEETAKFIHRGIARRGFQLRFSLADYIEVADAYLDNGMLYVALVRNVPEAMKPRAIAIKPAGTGKALPKAEKAA